MELGQAFRRLGSDVVVIEAAPDALAREDRDLAEVVLAQLRADGVEVMTRTEVLRAEATQDGLVLQVKGPEGDERWIEGSHLLVAAGRRPVVEGMDLDAGDVAHDQTGVHVDKRLRSISNPAVFAVGDVVGREMFTHAAGAHASLFVRKALFAQRVDLERLLIPRVTYTDPELAAVGLTEAQARQRFGEAAKVITAPLSGNDRAVAEGDTRGFGKLITHKGKIVGAALVGRGAGDLIQPFVLAMASRLKLSALTGYVAPYPTRSEIVKRLAGAYFTPILFSGRTRMLVSLLKRLG
jgi:pyruvate/2-oxoglutarate dehydrogenase complex dihydrolipoamide dehydrogenase (E3) component